MIGIKKHRNPLLYNSKGETRLFLFLSFIIPFVAIWIAFVFYEVHPFGDQQILVTDLWHQYYPFFREEHEKLQDMSSLLYSWNTGLGTNFLSIMSYYAASPLNLLSVFIPIEYSRDIMTLLLTIKIGCAGLFCAIFLKHVFKRNDITIVGFSICYALCNYIMGYYWNLIWIDTVAILPLVVLGTVMLVREGKYKLYIISLAISLIANFYIGLFTCIFTVLIFIAAVIINWKNFKTAMLRLLQISGATVISIGMGAFILLPAFLGLMLTNSVDNTFPEFIEFYETWFKMISNIIGFHEPTAKEGLPNFYCGMFAVILLGVFAVNRKIKIREKIVTILYLAFIIVSCNMNILNYIWHGFHFTNMLPYRFSFLFSFLLIAAAYRAFTVIAENISIFDILSMSAMTFIIALVSFRDQSEKAVLLSVAACFVYVVIMFIYERKIIKKKQMGVLITLVCMAEMGWNAYVGVTEVTTTSYSLYPKNQQQVTELLTHEADNDADFFRTEFTDNYSINDPALYGIKGVSQFSSTANVNVIRFLEELGIQASAAGNRYYYTQSTPIMNSFLNIRYLISHDGYIADETFLNEVSNSGIVELYENNAYLPLGFVADSKIMKYKGDGKTQADNQNELFKLASGIDEDILYPIKVKDVGHKGLNVTKSSEGNYSYQYDAPTDGSEDCYIKYNYFIEKKGPVYATVDFDNSEGFKLKIDDEMIKNFSSQKYRNITAAGSFDIGTVISFYADVDKDTSGEGRMFVYQINEEPFRKGIKRLSDGGLKISSYSSTEICGSFNAEKDGVLYTSIPYDGGWTAYIDGKKADVTSLKDALVCVPVTQGQHELVLKYSPPGFVLGTVISISSLILFAVVWIIEKKYMKKVPLKVTDQEKTSQDKETPEEVVSENTEDAQNDNEKKQDNAAEKDKENSENIIISDEKHESGALDDNGENVENAES